MARDMLLSFKRGCLRGEVLFFEILFFVPDIDKRNVAVFIPLMFNDCSTMRS